MMHTFLWCTHFHDAHCGLDKHHWHDAHLSMMHTTDKMHIIEIMNTVHAPLQWRAQLTCAQIWCTDWIWLVRSWFLNYLSAVEKPFRSMDTQFQYYFRRFWQTHLSATTGEVTTRMGGCGLQVESNYVLEGCILHRWYRIRWKAAGNEGQLCIRMIHRCRIRRTIIYRNDTQALNRKDNYISDKQGDNPVTASDWLSKSRAKTFLDSCR